MKSFGRKAISVNSKTFRIAALTTTLVLYVLSAGAPGCIGGGGQ